MTVFGSGGCDAFTDMLERTRYLCVVERTGNDVGMTVNDVGSVAEVRDADRSATGVRSDDRSDFSDENVSGVNGLQLCDESVDVTAVGVKDTQLADAG